jgi:hypothetical protein
MTHWSDRNRIEELSTQECELQDDEPCYIDEAQALVERKTLERLIGDLTYSCYAHNRRISPKVTPEQWSAVFGPKTAELELRFQNELIAFGEKEEDWRPTWTE